MYLVLPKVTIQFLIAHTLLPPPSSPHPSSGSPPHAPHRDHFMHSAICDSQVLFRFFFIYIILIPSFSYPYCRFYNNVEKWKMRQIAMELGCAALTPAHLWQSICNNGSILHVDSVMRYVIWYY